MKTIKYRAWHKEHERYEEVYEIGFFQKRVALKISPCEIMYFSFDEIILEQWTGLYDKNGKEIYSGDLLDFDEAEWGGTFTPEVITLDKLISGDICGVISDIKEFRQVIGNIHENKDLLKE